MPLHEYECESCGHRFEVIQKFSDPPIATCPKCGGPVRKLISSPAFHLKGSGWYVTDYGRKDQGGGSKGEEKSAEKADKAAEKGEKDKSEKSEKSEKSDKSEKSEKAGDSAKTTEKPASSSAPTPKKD